MIKNISGYSTALFSTWYFIDDLDILFDCGDGVTASLLAKTRKIKHIFISHPDRDHITGLSQLLQLNARGDFPKIYYPKDSGSFPAMKNFLSQFDPHVMSSEWIPLDHGQEIILRPGLLVRAFKNSHVDCEEGIIKSLSYKIVSTKKKLNKEYLGLKGAQIKELKEKKKESEMFYEVETVEFIYSGDTPIEYDGRWNDAKILIHEATFFKETLEAAELEKNDKHSTIEEVMEMIANSNVQKLILGHFSIRYSKEQIRERVRKLQKKYDVKIPIHIVFPGETVEDILNNNLI